MNLSCQAASKNPISLPEPECELTIGWGLWSPYQYRNEQGIPTGLQIELIEQIAKQAECQLNYVLQSFDENQQSIKKGDIDLTMDITITEERQAYGYFSEPYRQEVMALYVKPEFIADCESIGIEAMIRNGIRIGLTKGNIYGDAITQIQTQPALNSKFIYNNSNAESFILLEKGLIDGLIEDPTVLAYNLRKKQMSGLLSACKVTVYEGKVSLMFSKKTVSQDMVKRFDKALEKVKSTIEYQRNWAW